MQSKLSVITLSIQDGDLSAAFLRSELLAVILARDNTF